MDFKEVDDLYSYFRERSELVVELAGRVKIVDVNPATLRMYKAATKEELFKGLPGIFSNESYRDFIEALVVIVERKKEFFVEKTHNTLDGDKLDVQRQTL